MTISFNITIPVWLVEAGRVFFLAWLALGVVSVVIIAVVNLCSIALRTNDRSAAWWVTLYASGLFLGPVFLAFMVSHRKEMNNEQ